MIDVPGHGEPGSGRWSAGVAPLTFALLLVCSMAGAATAARSFGATWAQVGTGFGFVVAFFAGLWLARRGDPGAWHALGVDEVRRGVARGLVLAVPIFVLIFALQFVLGLLLKYLGVELPTQTALEVFTSPETPYGAKIGLVVVAACLAPLAEELLFRGLIHDVLRRRASFWPAAIFGSTLFGALHIESSKTIVFAIPLAVLGICLCWVREAGPWRYGGGRLWSCVVVHICFNAVMLALAAFVEAPPS